MRSLNRDDITLSTDRVSALIARIPDILSYQQKLKPISQLLVDYKDLISHLIFK